MAETRENSNHCACDWRLIRTCGEIGPLMPAPRAGLVAPGSWRRGWRIARQWRRRAGGGRVWGARGIGPGPGRRRKRRRRLIGDLRIALVAGLILAGVH